MKEFELATLRLKLQGNERLINLVLCDDCPKAVHWSFKKCLIFKKLKVLESDVAETITVARRMKSMKIEVRCQVKDNEKKEIQP